MERLRRELDAEKEAHTKTSDMLALLRSAHDDSPNIEAENDAFVKSTTRKQGERKLSLEESEKVSKRAEAQRLTSILKVRSCDLSCNRKHSECCLFPEVKFSYSLIVIRTASRRKKPLKSRVYKHTCLYQVSDVLRNDIRYQIEKVDDLRYHLESDPETHRHRIRCLTEVNKRTSESLRTRERETNELKDQLAQLLVRLGDRSFLEVSDDAGAECSRQLENISALKALYNERLRVLTELRDTAVKELTDTKQKLEYSLKKSESLEEELKKAEDKV